MVFAKYVLKNGKKIGPYYYESVRGKDGKIRTKYLGKNPKKSLISIKNFGSPTKFISKIHNSFTNEHKAHHFIFLLLTLFFVFGFFALQNLSNNNLITGHDVAVASETDLDNDGVLNADDYCPETHADWISNVNVDGCAISVGSNDTYSVQPSAAAGKDTIIYDNDGSDDSNYPESQYNYGTNQYLSGGNTPCLMLLEFNLTALPSNSELIYANLSLNVVGAPSTLSIYKIDSFWKEGAGSGSGINSDSINGSTWIEKYFGDNIDNLTSENDPADWNYNGSDVDVNIFQSIIMPTLSNEYFSVDIAGIAQGWINESYDNYGLGINATGGADVSAIYTSDITGQEPNFTILYIIPDDDLDNITDSDDLCIHTHADWITNVTGFGCAQGPGSNDTFVKIYQNFSDEVDDTYFYNDSLNYNKGIEDDLYIGGNYGSSITYRTLLKYNITSYLPVNVLVDEAILSLWSAYVSHFPTEDLELSLYPINRSWEEGVAVNAPNSNSINGTTWDERFYGLNWDVPGGDFMDTSLINQSNITITNALEEVNFTILEYLNNLLNGTYLDQGILIKLSDEWNRGSISFYSAEYNASLRPIITVQYSVDAGVPIITNLVNDSITSSSVTITWTTNENANSTVYYGTDVDVISQVGSSNLETSHSVVLSSLGADTVYYYNVSSCDKWKNCNISEQENFTTAAGPDAIAPLVSAVASSSITPTDATITWITSENANSTVYYGTTVNTETETGSATLEMAHSVALSSLDINSTYYYNVSSCDATANCNISEQYNFTTYDTSQPVITNLLNSSITSSSATITWTTDEDSNSTVYYGTTVNTETETGSATLEFSHSVGLSGLSANTTYYYNVSSCDGGANCAIPEQENFTTLDNLPPIITNLLNSSITSSSATITWTTDEDSNSTVYYGTTVDTATETGSATLEISHSVALSSLSASTTYYYNISSCDIDSNCNISEQETFTTSAATSQDNPSSGGSSASTTPSIIIPITEPIKQRLPELNLVETEKGQILDYEGGRHIIKLSENIEHIFEINKISEEEASFTLYSEPISFTLKKGESKKIDINSDKISDIQFKLNEIYNRNKVDVQITKLLGANLLPENKEILDQIPKSNLNSFKFILLGIISPLILFGIIIYLVYYSKNKTKSKAKQNKLLELVNQITQKENNTLLIEESKLKKVEPKLVKPKIMTPEEKQRKHIDSIKESIKQNLSRGFLIEDVENSLLKAGYYKPFVKQAVKEVLAEKKV